MKKGGGGLGMFERVHGGYVEGRRVQRLSRHLAELIPPHAQVLDVGCGDGALTRALGAIRSDLTVQGIDVLVRPESEYPVVPFDGSTIPFADASFDVVLFIDVLHHTDDPMVLLREAKRVARRGILMKDHLLQGPLAGATLRFMDRVGNARYGVALPLNYWTPDRWRKAFATLGLTGSWRCSLNLYPRPARWVFERRLHFLTFLESSSAPVAAGKPATASTCSAQTAWEEAYARFETPEEEIRKFIGRLRALGALGWRRDVEIVELFCGRGSSLRALQRLGFERLQGVDLSLALVRRYRGPARLHVADCRRLPFADGSQDVLVVQGGLHHLVELPLDLRRTLAEAHRVLRAGGLFLAVEPWSTPFLRFVHSLCRSRLLRRLYPKLDALAEMIDLEAQTYFTWLSAPAMVREEIERFFEIEECTVGWGKLRLRGRRREDPVNGAGAST